MNGSCILLPSLQRQYFREAHTFPEYGIYQQLIEKSCKHTINNRRKTEPCKHFTEINSVYICVCVQTGMLKIDIDATCCKSAYYVSQYLAYYTSRHFYLPLCLNSHPPLIENSEKYPARNMKLDRKDMVLQRAGL